MKKVKSFCVLNENERRKMDSKKDTIFEMKYEADMIDKIDIDCDFRIYLIRGRY